jgi:HAD superfamily hydrolase (TIGR01509 family)
LGRYRSPVTNESDAERPPAPARPGAVLLDLDGTLVDTVERRVSSWLQALDEAGFPTDRNAVAPLIGSDGRLLARRVARLAHAVLDEDRAEAIDQRAGELFAQLNVRPAPLPGAHDLLLALDSSGTPWAVATSSRREQVRASLDALALPREPTVIDGTHVQRAKPEPDLLLLAARRLGVDPTDAWCIGDSTFDMLAARAAGMWPIGVTTGAADAAALLGAGAAEVMGSLTELIPRFTAPPHAGGYHRRRAARDLPSQA